MEEAKLKHISARAPNPAIKTIHPGFLSFPGLFLSPHPKPRFLPFRRARLVGALPTQELEPRFEGLGLTRVTCPACKQPPSHQ